ncbi:hypothetical protein B0H14DRAFT_3009550 [Mycena olivaceomarginata]|nr:hypothetical protein B0H14DRAFT_3009550 [Mycena olivaceomarginata]
MKYLYGETHSQRRTKRKAVFEQAMEACGATNRCIITNEEVHNFCHLVEPKNNRRTEYVGGSGTFVINGPHNVVKGQVQTSTICWDNKQLVIIPDRETITQIKEAYVAIYAKLEQGEKPEPLRKWLFPMPDGGWTYKVLPLDIDPLRRIFRQKLQIEKKGETQVYTSTGLYEDFAYPYSDLSFRTHANPLCALWHAGAAIDDVPGVEKIIDQLDKIGAEDLLLYRLWPTADGTKSSPRDNPDPFLGSKPATEKDADPGTAISSSGVELPGEPVDVGTVTRDVGNTGNAHDVRNVLRGDAPQSGSADSLARDFSFMFSFDNSTIHDTSLPLGCRRQWAIGNPSRTAPPPRTPRLLLEALSRAGRFRRRNHPRGPAKSLLALPRAVAKKLEAKKARSRKQQQPPTQRSAQMEKAFTGGKPRIPTSRDLPKRGRRGPGNPASTPRLAGGSGGGTNSVSSSKLKGKETGAGESKKEPAPKQQWR